MRSITFRSLLVLVVSALAGASCGTTRGSASPDDVPAKDAAPAYAAPLTIEVLTRAHIGSDPAGPDYHEASADVDFSGGPFVSASLVLDLESSCFPFEQWTTNRPPRGERWPASCDAFDRNFETALSDPLAFPAGPSIELVRAITPFGGPMHIERDITDIVNALQGAPNRRLDILIPSYSDASGTVSGSHGGWTVSAHVVLTPGTAPRNVLAVVPLVYDNATKGATVRSFPFTLPAGTKSARLEYLATGHGGGAPDLACIGPADEFCTRAHTLRADGVAFLVKASLWRADCETLCTMTKGGPVGSYCLENPCGAPESVRAPRANWCPGSETPPLLFEPPELASPGLHTVDISIDKIADAGTWELSLKVLAFGD